MTRTVIVPIELANQINTAIDKALDGRECQLYERRLIFQRLLTHYDEHGVLPYFELKSNWEQA